MAEKKNILKKLTKKKFVRNVFIVASGTAFAQGLLILFSPIITRIYGPEIFGVLGVFTSVANIIIPISALTLPIAIVLPKDDEVSEDLAQLSLKSTIFVAILITIIVFFGGKRFLELLNAESIGSFIYLLPLIVIFSGVSQIAQQRLYRIKNFKIDARVQVVKTMLVNTAQVFIGLIIPHSIVLILSTIMGYGIQALMLLKYYPMKITYKLINRIFTFSDSEKVLIKEYRDFPLYRMPQIFINSFSNNLPIMLLSIYFGPASVGFYTLGKKVLGLPSQLVGQAIGDVFYPHASEIANSKQKVTPLLLKSTVSLIAIGIIPFGLVMAIGPWLFTLVFGQEWYTAGVYAQWLSFWSFFVFINRPSIRMFPIISAQQFFLKFEIFGTVIKSLSILLGAVIFKDELLTIISFSLASVLVNLALILYSIYLTYKFDQRNIIKISEIGID